MSYKMSGNPVKKQRQKPHANFFFLCLTYLGRVSVHNGCGLCRLIDKAS